MVYTNLSKIMRNLDEGYLYDLLGQLKESLVEWSFDGKALTLKQNLVDVIIAIKGLDLFNDESFRYNFLLATNDIKLIDKLCVLTNITKKGTDDYFSLSSKISKIAFKENNLYQYLIREYLEIHDYEFKESSDTSNAEFISIESKGMNELYDYQYMIKQQAINDLSNEEKGLYKILIHMPTGTGKTKTTMHIISHYINHLSKAKGLVVWIAHSDGLLLIFPLQSLVRFLPLQTVRRFLRMAMQTLSATVVPSSAILTFPLRLRRTSPSESVSSVTRVA